jgi:hypothetical protein
MTPRSWPAAAVEVVRLVNRVARAARPELSGIDDRGGGVAGDDALVVRVREP